MGTTFLVVQNNAVSTLASGINDSVTSLDVASGEGTLFPSTYPYHITLDDEIMSVTARSTDTLTVVRAQQGTAAVSHSADVPVELRITAKSFTDLNTAVNTLEGTVADDVVLKALWDAANTLVKADVQSTPEGLTVAEQRLVGRITSGNIAALTGAQVMAMLSGQAGAAFSLNSEDLSYVGHIGLGNYGAISQQGIYYEEVIEIGDNTVRDGILSTPGGYKTSAIYTGILTSGHFRARIESANTQNWSTTVGLRGVQGIIETETGGATAGTVTGAASLYAGAQLREAANDTIITNYFGLYVEARSLVGNSRLTNDYGIWIGDQAGGATLNYALYTNAGLVRFGDAVTLASTLALGGDVAGGGYALDNIGHIGLGNQPANATYGLYYLETSDAVTAGGFFGLVAYKTSATFAGTVYGGAFEAYVGSSNTQLWTNAVGIQGVYSLIGTQGGTAAEKTVTGMASFFAESDIQGGANDIKVANYYGLYVAANSLVSNDKLTNDYGIKVEDQEGGAVLNYAIHTGLGLVHFGDDVDIAASKVLKTDTINEITGAAGVTVDTVLIKDGEVDGVDISAHEDDSTAHKLPLLQGVKLIGTDLYVDDTAIGFRRVWMPSGYHIEFNDTTGETFYVAS